MELEQSLQQHFGFSSFRGEQKDIITAIVAGNDVLTLMSTGGGKSLCFQLPAVLLPGLTVVISPLISLMEDQVAHLTKNKILATWITHLLPSDETQYRLELVTIEHYKLVYVSPERLQDDAFCAILQTVPISLVVVDEAHCISEWGHEFRPEYRQISRFLARFSRRPTVAAFTATATLSVAKDIVQQLTLQRPTIFHTSVTRTNLALQVVPCFKQQEKWLHLLRVLRHYCGENGIIYTTTREGAEQLALRLQELARHAAPFQELRAGYYHAGLDDETRRINQRDFQSGKYNLLCATTAFGMGIDKGDIRFVIHTDHPNCLESYYQQVGRAGRDGLPSSAYLFFHPNDYQVHRQMIHQLHDLETKKRNSQRLVQMVNFCQQTRCRMQQITAYFGEITDPCDQCDCCRQLHQRHPYFQTPLAPAELDIIPKLQQSAIVQRQAGQRRSSMHLTDMQLLTAQMIEPVDINSWQFVPGCGKGWRKKYERHQSNH